MPPQVDPVQAALNRAAERASRLAANDASEILVLSAYPPDIAEHADLVPWSTDPREPFAQNHYSWVGCLCYGSATSRTLS